MKIIHTNKSNKVNELPITNVITKTQHSIKGKTMTHEGWAVGGDHEEKEHQYFLMFTVEEAKDFYKWLERMIPRFESEDLDKHITRESS